MKRNRRRGEFGKEHVVVTHGLERPFAEIDAALEVAENVQRSEGVQAHVPAKLRQGIAVPCDAARRTLVVQACQENVRASLVLNGLAEGQIATGEIARQKHVP